MADESVFLYTVNPRKVITGLSGCNAIRTSKSLFLTKEDVKVCLQRASVYRRFAAEDVVERVNIGNIDRLHRENYVSEADWEKVVAKEMSEGHGKVNDVKPVAEKIEESKQVAEPEKPVKVDEVVKSDDEETVLKEAEPVVEEVVETAEEKIEEATLDEVASDEEVQTEPETIVEESAVTTESTEKENNNAQKFTYNKKKK